ncbi:MAG: hypothetical protein J6P03_07030, partial [Opitutales bacterium]|nr:hypothetical protein [Opitutales bacterium]
MKIRFHLRMAAITKLSRVSLTLGAIIVFASVLSLGRPLNLSEYFPASFAQFFVWVCAFPILTAGAAVGSFADLTSLPFWDTLASEKVQMASIGALALLNLFIVWAFIRYVVLKLWGLEWVNAGTTILKCFVIWGFFQIACVFIAYAWSFGGFKSGDSEPACAAQSAE